MKPKIVSFTVYGLPQSKGSSRGFVNKRTGRVIITSTNKRLKDWEHAVGYAARDHAKHYFGAGVPVHLEMVFYMPRPKRPKSAYPVTRPDASKLWRAAEDALTRVLYADDSQVVSWAGLKLYANDGEPPSCTITLKAI
jgi:crossover junction endodeoxyribonuclease RusA